MDNSDLEVQLARHDERLKSLTERNASLTDEVARLGAALDKERWNRLMATVGAGTGGAAVLSEVIAYLFK